MGYTQSRPHEPISLAIKVCLTISMHTPAWLARGAPPGKKIPVPLSRTRDPPTPVPPRSYILCVKQVHVNLWGSHEHPMHTDCSSVRYLSRQNQHRLISHLSGYGFPQPPWAGDNLIPPGLPTLGCVFRFSDRVSSNQRVELGREYAPNALLFRSAITQTPVRPSLIQITRSGTRSNSRNKGSLHHRQPASRANSIDRRQALSPGRIRRDRPRSTHPQNINPASSNR